MKDVKYRLFCNGWIGTVCSPVQLRTKEQITYDFKDYTIISIRYSFDFNGFQYVIVGLEEKE